MSLVIWNAHGLGSRCAFLHLSWLVDALKPSLLFISESRVPTKLAYNWLRTLNFNGLFGVNPKGSKGGLLLFWSNEMDVSLRSYSFNHIDVKIVWNSNSWRLWPSNCRG